MTMKKAAAFGTAMFAVALALPAFGEEGAAYEASAGHRSATADHAFHATALDPADQELANRVVDALNRDRKVHNSPVTVWVSHGDVTLIGPVDNAQTVNRLEQVARRVAGPRHVFPMV